MPAENRAARIVPKDPDETCLGCGEPLAACDARWRKADAPLPGAGSEADAFLLGTCACPPLRDAVRGLEHTLELMRCRIENNDRELGELRAELERERARFQAALKMPPR